MKKSKSMIDAEEKYQKSQTGQRSMRFCTSHSDNDNFDGVIIHIKPEFIVLHEHVDFEFDGIVVLPKRWIKSIRDDEHDEIGNQILQCSGMINNLRVPQWLDSCKTVYQLLNALKEQDIWPVIEILFGKERKSALYIGPLTDVSEDEFSIRCYDAVGQWEKEYVLDYHEIFKIVFDDKYSTYFNAFMRSKEQSISEK